MSKVCIFSITSLFNTSNIQKYNNKNDNIKLFLISKPIGEQTVCQNQLLDKVSKNVLGHNVEKNIINWQLGTKCRILPSSTNSWFSYIR
jgi:hypothetical protein